MCNRIPFATLIIKASSASSFQFTGFRPISLHEYCGSVATVQTPVEARFIPRLV